MQKGLARLSVSAAVLCLLSFVCPQPYAQERDISKDANRNEAASDPKAKPHVGIVRDWSTHHLVYPLVGPVKTMIELQNDPRAIQSWQDSYRQAWRRSRDPHPVRAHQAGLHTDWSISLGVNSTAAYMYPAKYTFDPTATPSCANDFIVFAVDQASAAARPSLVALNNLYSGTAGATGICDAPADGRTVGADDNGTSATVLWSYNVESAPSAVITTSPALSLDGTKVAFMEENLTLDESLFHVLAPKNGDGVAANRQTATSPKLISSFTSNAPTAGSGTATSLALPITGTDSLSSPFIDYPNDVAYVGDNNGTLYRIKDVFCTVDPACTGGTPPAPSLDTSWPASGGTAGEGYISVCTGRATGPVVASGNVFVGCTDGKLYGFSTSTGAAINGSPLTVGDGSAIGEIVDPPLVDAVNGFLYVVSGTGSGTSSSVLVQARTTDLSSSVVATLGTSGAFHLHAPALNNAYFTAPYNGSVANVQGTTTTNASTGNTSNWQIYEWADSGGLNTLYGIGFNSSHVMTPSSTTNNILQISSSTAAQFSPVTEFFNTSTGTDAIFASAQSSTTPNLILYNLTDFSGLFPNAIYPSNSTSAVGGSASESFGTSGIVIDNDASSTDDPQASSIYFGAPSAHTAVKLTQSGLE